MGMPYGMVGMYMFKLGKQVQYYLEYLYKAGEEEQEEDSVSGTTTIVTEYGVLTIVRYKRGDILFEFQDLDRHKIFYKRFTSFEDLASKFNNPTRFHQYIFASIS